MKKVFRTLFVIIASGLTLTSCSTKETSCTLKGRIHDRTSDTLILIKATEDPRFNQVFIPIKDSIFEYEIVISYPEAYELIFKEELDRGAWRPVYFIAEKGEVNFELYSNPDANKIIGNELNSTLFEYNKNFLETFRPEFQSVNDSMQALMERNEYYSEEMKVLHMELANAQDQESRMNLREQMSELNLSGNDLTPKAKAIKKIGDSIKAEATKWRYLYINENPSIVTYYFLLNDIKSIKNNGVSIEDIKRSYPGFARNYPKHPYTSIMKNILEGYEAIKIGGKYIDFSLPDLDGRYHKLSEIIEGKYALIDLWASWCGPCIATSRSMLPVYEEFKDKEFTICGVAAEIDNTNQMRDRIEKEKFPWINLVELNHGNQIWDKYGISNSGGGTFLVDKEGIILAVNPNADEVSKILTEKTK